MNDRISKSPFAEYQEHCARGELCYQVSPAGNPVFYPRVAEPTTGAPLEWRTSAGRGVVYATTTVHPREGESYNVSIVETEELIRLMSRIEGIPSDAVTIGMRVRLSPDFGTERCPYPVFVPEDNSR